MYSSDESRASLQLSSSVPAFMLLLALSLLWIGNTKIASLNYKWAIEIYIASLVKLFAHSPDRNINSSVRTLTVAAMIKNRPRSSRRRPRPSVRHHYIDPQGRQSVVAL